MKLKGKEAVLPPILRSTVESIVSIGTFAEYIRGGEGSLVIPVTVKAKQTGRELCKLLDSLAPPIESLKSRFGSSPLSGTYRRAVSPLREHTPPTSMNVRPLVTSFFGVRMNSSK